MKYVLKKITGLIITLLIVTMLVFLAFELIPGDPATAKLGTEATPEQVEALREEMGLNEPLPARYVSWITNFLQGDMGTSYKYEEPVHEMIGDKLPVTLTLTGISFVLIILLSIPLGIICAKYENTWIDRLIVIMNQITMSIPPFFVGMILTVIFGLTLRWFVPGGYISYQDDMAGFIGYLIFPAIAVALPRTAQTVKLLRNSLIAEMHQDYVRTAYSRGNSATRVLLCHVFRNGILPVITFLGMALANMITNSLVVEQVFGIPGIGRTLISSISNRDYPVVEALIVLIALVILVTNTVVDLLYQKLDKRIEIA
ncbi:MAG: ABC transporter permease [Schaedlerella sp.]|nr:ABC transporter permease [Schaedlerella sp.]